MRVRTPSSLVGISLEGDWIAAAVVRNVRGRVQVRERLRAPLSLNPLVGDPDLVGREIHNHLADAGIRERRCVVCVPLRWVFTLRTELPDVSEEDAASFLAVQAERAFPFSPEDLYVSSSRYRTPLGTRHATVVAIPKNYVTRLQRVLKAARLRPFSITLGIASISSAAGSFPGGAAVVTLAESGIELGVVTAGGVVAARPLDDAMVVDRDGRSIDADLILRQLRITLAQIPEDLRDAIREMRVFGPVAEVVPLVEALEAASQRTGLIAKAGAEDLARVLSDPAEVESLKNVTPTAFAAGAGFVLGHRPEFEFLPPRSSRFKQLAGKVSSRRTRWLSATAALLAIGVVGSFFYQHDKLSRLETEWTAVEPKVKEMEDLQGRIRKFRPWFEDSLYSLAILRALSEAFPEKGTVWAKDLDIKDSSQVTCSGFARTNQDWLDMLDRLRSTQCVKELKVHQVQGKAPLAFTLSFLWSAEEADGS